MISIYASLFNIENNLFDWKETLVNFSNFANEVVIATSLDCKDDTVKILSSYFLNFPSSIFKLIVTDIKFDDYAFDGKIKNAALQGCSHEYCILLDFDEVLPLSTKDLWINSCKFIKDQNIDGLLIPSINLCGSMETFKDINYKFYLHKKQGMNRGIWNGAKRDDGFINTSSSDTCELIDNFGNLARLLSFSNRIEDIRQGGIPYVFHKWAVDFDKRIGQNSFWRPVWNMRGNKEIDDPILTKEDFEKIPVFPHGLSLE